MRNRPLLNILLLIIGFTGLVLWASDAFSTGELIAITGAIGLMALFALAFSGMAGEADDRLEAEDRRRQDELDRAIAEIFAEEDRSDVRHGGLGR